MTNSTIAQVKNFSLFNNKNDKVMFFRGKDSKVKADYSMYEKDKGLSVQGIKATSEKVPAFIKLSMSLGEGGSREFANGALFPNLKKTSANAPDLTGILELRDEAKTELRLAGWYKKSDSQVEYISVAISEFRTASADTEVPEAEVSSEAEAAAEAEAASLVDADAAAEARCSGELDDEVPY